MNGQRNKGSNKTQDDSEVSSIELWGLQVMVMEVGRQGKETVWGKGKGTVTAFAPDIQSFWNLLSLTPCKSSRRRIENVVTELRTEEQARDEYG